jgi:hypothetical protein
LKEYQRKWLETLRDFTGLWDRFDTLYLQGITLDEVTEEREDEFLQFQGAMVEQLVKVGTIDHGRFDVHDLVMAVIHDAPSLGHLARQSDFQRRRLRQSWGEASQALSKLSRFCETYTPKLDKTSRLQEVRRANPFWDPAGGGFQATLTKLAIGPVTFFAGLRPSRDEKANWFLFKILIIPLILVFLVLAIANLETVQQMARNFGETSGLLPEAEGFVPKLLIHAFALVGVLILALVATVVLMILALLHEMTLHAVFKIFGGKSDFKMTRRIVIYGAAPIVAIITAPYAIVLQMIGANKAQKIPPVLAPFAWLIGTALLVVLVLAILFAVYHFTGQIPSPGEYVQVKGLGATLYEPRSLGSTQVRQGGEIASGRRLEYKGEMTGKLPNKQSADFYRVVVDGQEKLLLKDDGEIKEFRRAQIVLLLFELTRDKVMFVVTRLSRELGAEAD